MEHSKQHKRYLSQLKSNSHRPIAFISHSSNYEPATSEGRSPRSSQGGKTPSVRIVQLKDFKLQRKNTWQQPSGRSHLMHGDH